MDEQVLLSQIQQGDRNAYKQMFIKYFSPLCEYATQYVSNADSEELVQDLMLHCWEAREYLAVEKSLKSYLFVSVRNRCLNAIRNNQCKRRIHSDIYEKLKYQFEDPDYYLYNELANNIEKAIQELPESYRETFIMSRFGEMTNSQIATEIGVSIKTVEYRITQSLKILRVKLKDYLLLLILLG